MCFFLNLFYGVELHDPVIRVKRKACGHADSHCVTECENAVYNCVQLEMP